MHNLQLNFALHSTRAVFVIHSRAWLLYQHVLYRPCRLGTQRCGRSVLHLKPRARDFITVSSRTRLWSVCRASTIVRHNVQCCSCSRFATVTKVYSVRRSLCIKPSCHPNPLTCGTAWAQNGSKVYTVKKSPYTGVPEPPGSTGHRLPTISGVRGVLCTQAPKK